MNYNRAVGVDAFYNMMYIILTVILGGGAAERLDQKVGYEVSNDTEAYDINI